MKISCRIVKATQNWSIMAASGCNCTCLLASTHEINKLLDELSWIHALKAEFLKFSLFHLCTDCHYTQSGHHGIKQTSHGRLVYIYTVKEKLWSKITWAEMKEVKNAKNEPSLTSVPNGSRDIPFQSQEFKQDGCHHFVRFQPHFR